MDAKLGRVNMESTEVSLEVVARYPLDPGRVLWTLRLNMPPVGEIPYWSHPDLTLMYVESGVLAITAVTGNLIIVTKNAGGGLQKSRAVTGREYQLQPTEFASFGVGVQHSIRNPATGNTIFNITMIAPGDVVPYDGMWTSSGSRIRLIDEN